MTLYVEYYSRNGLFFSAGTNTLFARLGNRNEAPAPKHVGSHFRLIAYFILQVNAFVTELT